jgi:hypothetical protein
MSHLVIPGQPKIWYEERPGSQKFSYVGNLPKATREFRVGWTDRWDFVRALLGTAELKDIQSAQPYVSRVLPHAYQSLRGTKSDLPFLYCTTIDEITGVAPTPGEFGLAGPTRKKVKKTVPRANEETLYKEAFVRATYEAPTYHVAEDKEVKNFNPVIHSIGGGGAGQVKPSDGDFRRFVTKIIQPAVEVIRLPVGFYTWAEGIVVDGKERWPKDEAQQNITGSFRIKSYADITYVWHMVPALPKTGWYVEDVDGNGNKVNPETIGAVYTHLGCVNSDWFDGHPPGTLLLKGAEAKPYRWVDGQRYYDYTFHVTHFQPIDKLEPDATIVRAGGGPRPLSAIPGHNYFLRATFPTSDKTTGVVYFQDPIHLLLTHNGKANGRPVFQYRDFNDLFTPFNRAHLIQYYSNVDVGP